jgi:hypothetical protein
MVIQWSMESGAVDQGDNGMGVVINLDDYVALVNEYLTARGEDDFEIARRLLFSDFLVYLQERQLHEQGNLQSMSKPSTKQGTVLHLLQ